MTQQPSQSDLPLSTDNHYEAHQQRTISYQARFKPNLKYGHRKHLFHFQHWDSTIPGLNLSVSSERCVREWSELQDGQHILITTPSVLLGFRLKVYRAEGTTQWYTAVTTGYNESNNVSINSLFLRIKIIFRIFQKTSFLIQWIFTYHSVNSRNFRG